MKRILSIPFLICAFYLIPTYCQNARQDEIRALNAQIPPLVAGQKYDELLPIAERIVMLEKEGGETNVKNYFFALLNLARWSDRRIDLYLQRKKTGIKSVREEMLKVTNLYEDVLGLAQKAGMPLQLAAVQFDVAFFYYRHKIFLPDAVALYRQSLSTLEKLLPPGAAATLLTIEKLSDLHFFMGNFEEFLPLNRRLVDALSRKSDDPSKTITVSSLTLYAQFLRITDREREAAQIGEQITAITGKPFTPTGNDSPLLNRSLSETNLSFGSMPHRQMPGGMISVPNPTTMRSSGETSIPLRDGIVVTVRGSDVVDQMVTRPASVGSVERKFQYIVVGIVIDETGEVIEVLPETPSKNRSKAIIKRVIKWKFKPFAYNGMAGKMRGKFKVAYYY